MYLDIREGVFHCHKCKESGGFIKLLRKLDMTEEIPANVAIDAEWDDRQLLDLSFMEPQLNEEEQEWVQLEVYQRPLGYKRIFRHPYLKKRGFTDEDYELYEVGTATDVRLRDRVILTVEPSDLTILGYLGRTTLKNDKRPRYFNQPGCDFSRLLYGFEHHTDQCKTVILVEGAFDKIAVDRFLELSIDRTMMCLATFGNKVSKNQAKRLQQAGVENVILIYDRDAVKQIIKTGFMLDEMFESVLVNHTVSKDPADSTAQELMRVFDSVKTIDDYSQQLFI